MSKPKIDYFFTKEQKRGEGLFELLLPLSIYSLIFSKLILV